MKKREQDSFSRYRETLSESENRILSSFFLDVDRHCLIAKSWKKELRWDFEKAILFYHRQGVSLEETLRRLDARNLGGFYARPASLWFALDDAAKVYPLSMGRNSMAVFRLSAYMNEEIVPELLQMALTFAIRRFPGFATTLKKGFFWHYLDTSKRRFAVEVESDPPCQPLKVGASGSQSFRVLYWKNRVSVEFFHVLTDGTGGVEFLKVLIGEYLRLLGVGFAPDGLVMDVDETPDLAEMENAFRNVPMGKQASGFVDKTALQMNGKLSRHRPYRIIHFKMDAASLLDTARRYDTTVTVYLLALMFLAGRAATDELEGQCSIQVPVNMRKFYPSKTLRNFSMYCGIRLNIEDIQDINTLIPQIQQQLSQKGARESMSQMLTATKKLVSSVRYIPLAVKQPVAKAVYGFLGDKIFSNTLSNLGVVKLPEPFYDHVKSMDFILGTAMTNRAECSLVTCGKIATFSVSKLTADPTFEEKMDALLRRDGIDFTVEGSDCYEY